MMKYGKKEIKKIVIIKKSPAQKLQPAVKKIAGHPAKQKKEEKTYEELIYSAARKHNVDPALVKAVVKAESNFNPKDTSCKGACGLMQLMPDTARLLGVEDIYEPSQNINAGTKYLSTMLYQFNGDLEKALAAYNAGPAVVRKYKTVPPYKETKSYIKTVYRNYQRYRNSDRIYTYTDDKGCLNIYNVK